MNLALSFVLATIFFLIAAIHLYWAIGGKWAADAVLPTKSDSQTLLFKPSLFPTLIVAIGLLCIGVFVLIKADFLKINLPILLNKYGLIAITIIFLLRAIGDFKYVGFFKKVKQTKFGKNDTILYSPLCLLIALFTLLLHVNT